MGSRLSRLFLVSYTTACSIMKILHTNSFPSIFFIEFLFKEIDCTDKKCCSDCYYRNDNVGRWIFIITALVLDITAFKHPALLDAFAWGELMRLVALW